MVVRALSKSLNKFSIIEVAGLEKGRARLMLRGVQYYVEDVVSAEQNVSVVGKQLFILAFGCSFQQDVHVPVAFDHFSLVFAAVFENDFDVSV